MNGVFFIALLLALPAQAGRPVARPVRGGLDERVVTQDSVGVLVQFEGVTKADAEKELDAVAKQQRLAGGLRVGFFKTPKATLASVYVTATGTVWVKTVKDLAEACSKMTGAKAAWAFVHPGPTDTELEIEAFWRFEPGQPVVEKRLAFRDDEGWVEWNRRRLSDAELSLKKWPGWPLSELAISLGVPGRDFFERPMALLDLSTWEFPRDVGANQVLTVVYLPDATLFEVRQLAEARKASPSKLIEDALIAAEGAGQLGLPPPVTDRAPWDDEPKGEGKPPLRELPVFLTEEVWGRLDVAAQSVSLSASKVMEYAWRQQHPWSGTRKKPK